MHFSRNSRRGEVTIDMDFIRCFSGRGVNGKLREMPMGIRLNFAVASIVFSTTLAAQLTEDSQGCKDPKLLTRLPGCFIESCETKDFDQLAIRNGAHKDENDPVKTLEGAVETRAYQCSGKTSPLQVVRNSAAALLKAGYQSVFNGKDENEFLTVTMRQKDQWVQVTSSAGGDNNSITFYTFKAVAVTAMNQEMEATADAIANELQASGHMALYGITFARTPPPPRRNRIKF